MRESLHRLDRDRLIERQRVESRHAHQTRRAVDLCRTGAAFAGFAIPAAGEVVSLLGLNLVDGVEHDHPFGNFGRVVLKLAGVILPAPDAKGGGFHGLASRVF